MKTKSRKSVFLTSGIAALALLLCAACKPPLDPIIEVAVDNRVAFSTTVAPLTFVDPARLLTGGGGVQSAVFELTEARTGEVSVYNDPECAVEAGLWAVVQGRRLTVAAGEGDIPEETPFYAVITEGGRASAPSAFALTRQERFEVPRTITWADVQDQINAGRPVVDLLNRRWDVDLVFDKRGGSLYKNGHAFCDTVAGERGRGGNHQRGGATHHEPLHHRDGAGFVAERRV